MNNKVIIFGASGNCGISLVRAGLDLGHKVSAFVRDSDKLRRRLGELPKELSVIEGDALDGGTVARALNGHSAAVNAIGDPADPRRFEALCRTIVTEAEIHLGPPKKFWQFGGLPGLDVPHTKTMGTDLPGMPVIFKSHKVNYELLLKTGLDWSFICPGPMFFYGTFGRTEDLSITTEVMPYEIGAWTGRLPKIVHPFVMRSRLKELIISYEDVAAFIMSNLKGGGPYSRKRIGIRYRVES